MVVGLFAFKGDHAVFVALLHGAGRVRAEVHRHARHGIAVLVLHVQHVGLLLRLIRRGVLDEFPAYLIFHGAQVIRQLLQVFLFL